MSNASDLTGRGYGHVLTGDGDAVLTGILDSVSAHLAVLDRDGNIIRVNEAWRRFARANAAATTEGYAATGEGTNYLAVCDASCGDGAPGSAEAAAGIRGVLVGSLPSFSLEYPCHAPSRPRWFLMSATPLAVSGGAVVTHTDITARKLGEIALRDSEIRLKLALEASGDGLWDWDLNSGLAYLSPGYYALTGYSADQVRPDLSFLRRLVLPEDWPVAWGAMADHLRGLTPSVDQEYRIRTAAGAVRWLRGRGRIVARNAHGEPTRMIGLITDVSERRRMETKRDELLEENTRLGRELIAVQEKERAALARELHDELSQDLAAIRAHAAAIRRTAAAGRDGQRTNAEAIEAGAGRIYAASHRLMEGLRPQVLDSAGLPDALVALVHDWSASHPGIKVKLRCTDPAIAADAETGIQLFRIVQECLANIAQHARARRVLVLLGRRHRDWLRLVVRDDGVGIPQAAQRRGHGLIVMRERAHGLGGRFDCRDVRGRGARIAVEVPMMTGGALSGVD
jgi:PAS domain S-box-containing protein